MSKPAQPTPISVIVKLYQKPNQPPLIIDKIDEIDIKTQIQYLDPDKCNTCDARNEIIRKFNNDDLRTNAYKRIRFKSMLCQYHKDWYKIKDEHFKMICNWTDFDFALNVIIFFIKTSDDGKAATQDKEIKRLNTTWRFLDYLAQFFNAKGFDGQEFISKHVPKQNDNNDAKKSSGFGLTIVKEVCKQFDQKTGQYTKVKKQLSAWAKKNVERHTSEISFNLDDIKENVPMDDNDNIGGGSIVQNSINNSNNNNSNNNAIGSGSQMSSTINNSKSKGEKWFWFCDEGGIKWVPYKDEHQQLIEDAWVNGKPSVIVMTRFKIDFHRDDTNGVASGQQYNYQIHNSWRRGVIRGTPDSKNLLNDIPCETHPR
eukprot:183288_1